MKQARGFSLIELMVAVTVAAILLVVAIPNFINMAERRRVMGAAEMIYEQLMYARTEAVKRSRPLIVAFSANDTATWSLGITDRNIAGTACDPTKTAAANANACTIEYDNDPAVDFGNDGQSDAVLLRADNTPYPNVRLKGASDDAPSFTGAAGACNNGLSNTMTCFDPVRGMARNGTVVVTTNKYQARVVISTLGRVRICSPNNALRIQAYPTCD